MKIDFDEDYTFRFKEVFNSVIFETPDGNELIVCMRDTGFEIAVRGFKEKSPGCEPIRPLHWYKADELGIRPLAFHAIRAQEAGTEGNCSAAIKALEEPPSRGNINIGPNALKTDRGNCDGGGPATPGGTYGGPYEYDPSTPTGTCGIGHEAGSIGPAGPGTARDTGGPSEDNDS